MKTLEIEKATASLAEYAENIKNDPVILTRNGKPVAALVSLENVDSESIHLSDNEGFIALIEKSRFRRKAEGGISSEEMRRKLGRD